MWLLGGWFTVCLSGGIVTVTDQVWLPIPDGNLTGTVARLNVSGLPRGQGIRDLNVILSIDGSAGYNGDLYAYITRKDNAALSVLLNRPGRSLDEVLGSAGSGFDRLVFDDEASNGDIHHYEKVVGDRSIHGIPWTGKWQPDGRLVDPNEVFGEEKRGALLDQFDGRDPNGEWLLFLADASPGGSMVLTQWALEFELDALVGSFSGVAGDGLLASATVYFDANLNGVLDAREPWVLTDEHGAYRLNVLPELYDRNGDGVLSAAEGGVAVFGGMNRTTGLPMELSLRAPLGTRVINSLTTLMAGLLIRDPNLSVAEAEARVEAALGLDPALAERVDLLAFEIFSEAALGNPDAVGLLEAVAEIRDTVVQVGSFVSGVNGVLRFPIIELAFEQLFDDLLGGKSLELTSRNRVRDLLDTVDRSLWNGLNDRQKDVATEIIVANNRFKRTVAVSETSVAERVRRLVQVQVQVQSEIANELRLAGMGQRNIQDVWVKNTHANLALVLNRGAVGYVGEGSNAVGVFGFDQSRYEVTEAGKTFEPVTVIRKGGSAGAVRLLVTPTRGEADLADFDSSAIEVEFAPFEIRKTIDLTRLIQNDDLAEGSEVLGLSLSLLAGYANGASLADQSSAELLILDDDISGTVSFAHSDFIVREDGDIIKPITLVRTEGIGGVLPVVVQIEGGEGVKTGAVVGEDFLGGSFLVTFADGNLYQTFNVPIIDDARVEQDEELVLSLKLAPQTPPSATLGDRSTATLIIEDNDLNVPPVISQIADQKILEDQALLDLPFTITDSDQFAGAIHLTVSSSNEALVDASGLVLAGGQGSRTLSVFPKKDASGITTIQLAADDGLNTMLRSFDLSVSPVNDVPYVTSLNDLEVLSGGDVVFSELQFSDVDSLAAQVEVSFVALTPDILEVSAIQLFGDGFTRQIALTPPLAGMGRAEFAIHLKDEDSTSVDFFAVDILETARPDVTLDLGEVVDVVLEEDSFLHLPISISVNGAAKDSVSFSLSGDNEDLISTDGPVFLLNEDEFSLLLAPNANAFGRANLELTASLDSIRATEHFQLTVLPVDDPPRVRGVVPIVLDEDESAEVTLSLSDIDSASSDLWLELLDSGNPVMLPEGSVSIQKDGSRFLVRISPRANVFGTATVRLRGFDKVNVVDLSLELSVKAVNDPPVISGDPSLEILEGTRGEIAFEVNDAESRADGLTVAVHSLTEELFPIAGLQLEGEGALRTLRIIPEAQSFGEGVIQIEVDDGEALTLHVVSVNVLKVDEPPRLGSLPRLAMAEDTVVVLDLDLTDPDTALEDLELAVVASNEVLFPEGSLGFIRKDGLVQLKVTPADDLFGESQLEVSVSDGVSTVREVFDAFVEGVDDPPRIVGLERVHLYQGEEKKVRFDVFDPDGGSRRIFVALASVDPELIDLRGVEVEGSGRAREFLLTHVEGQSGIGEVIVGVSDGHLVDTTRFIVEVDSERRVEPATAPLRISSQGEVLIISWNSPGILQVANDVNGPFTTVVDATSPFVVAPKASRRFFRLATVKM